MKSSRGVFICHASADKNRIVRTLAADLESMGVDVWFDEWELGPGDSLRSRIASGISGCAYFLVVVSSRSLKSSWVQWELDSGTIRQIEGSATVVPLVFGQLAISDLPVDLRAKMCIRFAAGRGPKYKAALEQLLEHLGASQVRWTLGLGGLSLLVPTASRLSVDVGWSYASAEHLDWYDFWAHYDVFLTGFRLENTGHVPVRLSSPVEETSDLDSETPTPDADRPLIVQMGAVIGSRRLADIADKRGDQIPGNIRNNQSYESRRRFKELSPKSARILNPGERLDVGFRLGKALVTGIEETEEVKAVHASRLLNSEWFAYHIDISIANLKREVMRTIVGTSFTSPLVVKTEAAYRRYSDSDSYTLKFSLWPPNQFIFDIED